MSRYLVFFIVSLILLPTPAETSDPSLQSAITLSERGTTHQAALDTGRCITVLGGITRMDSTRKEIYLAFTGHEFADGAESIRSTLRRRHVKASFFFTGDFYRNPAYGRLIRELNHDGHYLGGHSDKHLLYASWEKRDSLLVTKQDFLSDLRSNYATMGRFGIIRNRTRYFMPPFEWYNQSISNWCR